MRTVAHRLNLMRDRTSAKVTEQLASAGWRSRDAIVAYMIAKLCAPFAFGAGALIMIQVLHIFPLQEPLRSLVPMLAVGTEKDHVSPWRSVFRLHLLADTDVTFILTNGGHNAGILSEPGHPHRHFRMATQRQQAHYVDPDAWLADNAARDGSWWPTWGDWITERSGALGALPPLGQAGGAFAPLGEAPGEYVFMK